jgi:hypothetical protein
VSEHGLLYTRSPSNIHEIILQDVRSTTVTAFADCLKAIIAETPESEIMRLFIYVPAIPSIQYMLGTVREIRTAYPKVPPARIAVIYMNSAHLSILNMVVRAVVRISTLKLFLKKDEDEAREWLLK